MFDAQLRGLKDSLLYPLAQIFKKTQPSTLTFIGLAWGLLAGLCAAIAWYPLALVLWFLNRIFDGLDGFVARVFNKKSDRGAYLDLVADFIVYTAIPLGLAWSRADPSTWAATAFLLGSFYINAISWLGLALIEAKHSAEDVKEQNIPQTGLPMPRGLMEGFETIVLFSLFLILPNQAFWLFALGASLVLISALQRLIWALRGGI